MTPSAASGKLDVELDRLVARPRKGVGDEDRYAGGAFGERVDLRGEGIEGGGR